MSDQAKFGEPMLGKSYVSLLDLVEAIACQIAISDEAVDAYRDTSKDQDAFTTMLNRWPVKTGFQRSEGATIFIRHLANGPTGEAPRWFDVSLGFPLVREHIREEGMTELARMVKWAENYKRWYSSLRWYNPNDGKSHETPQELDLMPRVRLIGFDRAELIQFLDRNHIKHCLRAIPDTDDHGEESQSARVTASDASTQNLPHGTEVERGANSLKGAHQGQHLAAVGAANTVETKVPNFRGVLADVLLQAWENAKRRRSTHAIFAKLVELARQEPRQHPLIDATQDGHIVKYYDEQGVQQDFTIADMKSRMRAIPKSGT